MKSIPTVEEIKAMNKEELNSCLIELSHARVEMQLLKSAGKLEKSHTFKEIKSRVATVKMTLSHI